ncbi:MAG: BON domain-containing protein [Terriglobia bacterium]
MRRLRNNYRIFVPVLLALLVAGCSSVSHSPDDSQITSAIQAKLYQNPDLKPLSINVSSDHGVVTLSGAVNAPLEKLAVEDLAQKTTGVKQVIDQLSVAQADAPADAGTAPPGDQTMPEASAPRARRRPRERRQQAAENQPQRVVPPQQDQSGAAPASSASAAAPAPPAQLAPPAPTSVTIPAGTAVSVRMINAITSQTAQVGQTYSASLVAPLVAGDRVVIPQGANAKVRVALVTSAGRYQGRSELKLALVDISYNGVDYPVQTGYFDKQGASRGKNSAEKIGGGAALGALLGAVIGHGKGAGIGAAIGGAAGTVDQTATRGQQVTVPSETKIDFVLKAPLSVTLPSGG